VADQLAKHGRVPVAYLGAGLKDVPLDDGGSGAMVMTLDRDGPAAASGLQQGDIIISWAGKRLPHVGALLQALRAAPVGSTVTLGLRRGGSPLELAITIGDRPAKMSDLDPADDFAISIQIPEPDLATRLAALIEQARGLRIAKPNEPGDLVLSVPDFSNREPSSRSPHANAM